MSRKTGIQTIAVKTYPSRGGRRPLSIPIVQAVTFESESSLQLGRDFRDGSDHVYQRFGHPTTSAAAEKIAALEGAEAGLVFGSGMGAIATTLLALAGDGKSHVVAQRQIFAQTFCFLEETLRRLGVETTFVDVGNNDQLIGAFRGNTRLLYIESPSNPLLTIVDIRKAASVAKEHGALLVVDSTFGTPMLQRPIGLGADLVLHSATKFLAGHSDVLCGAAAGSRQTVRAVQEMQILLGTVLDPHAAWLLLRGLKTLGVRISRQSESALTLARFLQGDARVESVEYPWLESSPSYRIAREQMSAGGGVLDFTLKGGLDAAHRFTDALRLIAVATSLGGVESVIEIPADLDYSETELGDDAARTGIAPGLIRLSVGLEDIDDLLADLERGLTAIDPLSVGVGKSLACPS